MDSLEVNGDIKGHLPSSDWECEITDDAELRCKDTFGRSVDEISSPDERVDSMQPDTCTVLAETFIELDQEMQDIDLDEIDYDEAESVEAVKLQLMHEGIASSLNHGCPEFED